MGRSFEHKLVDGSIEKDRVCKFNCVTGNRLLPYILKRKEIPDGQPRRITRRITQRLQKRRDLLGKDGLVKDLTKALIERALQAELTEHLGYDKHAADGRGSGNSRNGTSAKTLKTQQGDLPLEVPRDRRGDFEPQLVSKGQRRSGVLEEKIIAQYARGLTVPDIHAHLD